MSKIYRTFNEWVNRKTAEFYKINRRSNGVLVFDYVWNEKHKVARITNIVTGKTASINMTNLVYLGYFENHFPGYGNDILFTNILTALCLAKYNHEIVPKGTIRLRKLDDDEIFEFRKKKLIVVDGKDSRTERQINIGCEASYKDNIYRIDFHKNTIVRFPKFYTISDSVCMGNNVSHIIDLIKAITYEVNDYSRGIKK